MEQRRPEGRSTQRQTFTLESFEKTQSLLEAHVVKLRQRFEQKKL